MVLLSMALLCANRVMTPVAGSVEITGALCLADKSAVPAKTDVVEVVETIIVSFLRKRSARRVRRRLPNNAVIAFPAHSGRL